MIRPRAERALSHTAIAERYGIPVATIRQYEIGRTLPQPTVSALLKVIAAEPERTAKVVAG